MPGLRVVSSVKLSDVIVVTILSEEGSVFTSKISGRVFQIKKLLTCTSDNVVYLASCVASDLQGVGSTINFKTRLANYKSHIKRNKITCGIVNHFLNCHGADHPLLKFKLIDQRHGNLRECEIFGLECYCRSFSKSSLTENRHAIFGGTANVCGC